MAKNQSFAGDHLRPTTTFSQLLFSLDHHDIEIDKNQQIFKYSVSDSGSSFATDNSPKMLCFGIKTENQEHQQQQPQLVFNSRLACSDSSSTSSGNALKKSDSKLKRRNGSNRETAAIKEAPLSNQKGLKKIKANAPSSAGHAKRKEKLGERISALHHMVSPFGKSDTASVLHEAMGYIKFLHEQVQVLCSPYLQKTQLFSSQSLTKGREKEEETEEDLKNRGLCLIPVECSLHLAHCTVADFWSPAMAMEKKL